MRLQRQSSGQIITLDKTAKIGGGGEGSVYEIAHDRSLAAKVYQQFPRDYANKLTTMVANPPKDPMEGKGQTSIAWPLDLLQTADGSQQIMGFLMQNIMEVRPAFEYYNPRTRHQHSPFFDYSYLQRTARNLATAVSALHHSGYVIGDVNESNVLVSDTALVTLVDTDSFQVNDYQNRNVYRCPVGKPEFTPPELQGQKFSQIDRLPEHDRFGLAVLIFQLLMEGTHPFAGIYQKPGDPPAYGERIALGHFPYGSKPVPYRPNLISPSFEVLHPTLQQLFIRCFEVGHNDPSARPDASTWQSALNEGDAALLKCSVNSQHRYGDHLMSCPWCQRTTHLGGRDPFPPLQSYSIQQPKIPAGSNNFQKTFFTQSYSLKQKTLQKGNHNALNFAVLILVSWVLVIIFILFLISILILLFTS